LVVCVSGTEQQLMRARDVLFWNQVISESIYLFCAWGFYSLTPRPAHFFCFSVFPLWLFCYQYPCQVSQDLTEMEKFAAFVVKPEGFIQGSPL